MRANAFFSTAGRGENKRGFLKIGFAGDVLHLRVAQTARIGKDGESVALEAVSRENINLDDVENGASVAAEPGHGNGRKFL